jgi:hypothetical protein
MVVGQFPSACVFSHKENGPTMVSFAYSYVQSSIPSYRVVNSNFFLYHRVYFQSLIPNREFQLKISFFSRYFIGPSSSFRTYGFVNTFMGPSITILIFVLRPFSVFTSFQNFIDTFISPSTLTSFRLIVIFEENSTFFLLLHRCRYLSWPTVVIFEFLFCDIVADWPHAMPRSTPGTIQLGTLLFH